MKVVGCGHACCRSCAINYYTLTIRDNSIGELTCPFCREPATLNDPDNEDAASDYFARLDLFLKSLVDEDVHDLFQRKLRDRTLMKDPNFKWCDKVINGHG